METQSIACQIARAQISRYVAGDDLGEDTVASLEAHIAECDECRLEVDARRIELQASLAASGAAEPEEPSSPANLEAEPATSDRRSSNRKGAAEKEPQGAPEPEVDPIAVPEPMAVPAFVQPEPSLDPAAVPAPGEQEPAKRAEQNERPAREKVPLLAMIRARLPKLRRAKSEAKTEDKPEAKTEAKPEAKSEAKIDPSDDKTNWKPLIYSGALAAVLITMSAFVQNPTSVFGDRAMKPGEKPANKSKGKSEAHVAAEADARGTDKVRHDAKEHSTEGESGDTTETDAAKAFLHQETSTAPEHEQTKRATTQLSNEARADALVGKGDIHESHSAPKATVTKVGSGSSAKPTVTPSKPPPTKISSSKAHRVTAHKAAPMRNRRHIVRRPRPASLKRPVQPRPKSSGNSIRVYDHDGKPIPTHSGE